MSKYEEKIAKITSTHLGYEDHGIPTFWLHLDYGGSGQGFGGYDLRHWGIDVLFEVMKACGVDSWEKVNGRTVIALVEHGLVRGIKPLPTEKGKGFVLVEGVLVTHA